MIKNVCFDLDGVIFSPDCFRNFKSRVAILTPHANRIDNVFHGSNMDEFKRGLITEDEFWQYADEELYIKLGIDGYARLLRESYVIQPVVVKIIRTLIEARKSVSICTNNFPTRIRAAQESTGFLDLIDTAIVSYEIGSLKPEKEIYQKLIDKSGCAPGEIFYSDDNEDKLQGAIDLGIHCEVAHDLDELFKKIKNLE